MVLDFEFRHCMQESSDWIVWSLQGTQAQIRRFMKQLRRFLLYVSALPRHTTDDDTKRANNRLRSRSRLTQFPPRASPRCL